jgi:hypothetical protein
MKKADLTCSMAIAPLLSNMPDDVEIGSVAVFVGVEGGGVFMGCNLSPRPEQVAAMVNAFGEAKRSVMENLVRDHGMETLVSVMYFLASSHPEAKELGRDPELFRSFFVPRDSEEE